MLWFLLDYQSPCVVTVNIYCFIFTWIPLLFTRLGKFPLPTWQGGVLSVQRPCPPHHTAGHVIQDSRLKDSWGEWHWCWRERCPSLGDYGCWRVYEPWDYRKENLIEKEEGEGEEGEMKKRKRRKRRKKGKRKGRRKWTPDYAVRAWIQQGSFCIF